MWSWRPSEVEDDERELLALITTVTELAADGEVCWATDLNAGGAALLIALLTAHHQQVLTLPGRIVHHAAATYRGAGKTDAKDARIIADQARMRTDLQPVRAAGQVAVVRTRNTSPSPRRLSDPLWSPPLPLASPADAST